MLRSNQERSMPATGPACPKVLRSDTQQHFQYIDAGRDAATEAASQPGQRMHTSHSCCPTAWGSSAQA